MIKWLISIFFDYGDGDDPNDVSADDSDESSGSDSDEPSDLTRVYQQLTGKEIRLIVEAKQRQHPRLCFVFLVENWVDADLEERIQQTRWLVQSAELEHMRTVHLLKLNKTAEGHPIYQHCREEMAALCKLELNARAKALDRPCRCSRRTASCSIRSCNLKRRRLPDDEIAEQAFATGLKSQAQELAQLRTENTELKRARIDVSLVDEEPPDDGGGAGAGGSSSGLAQVHAAHQALQQVKQEKAEVGQELADKETLCDQVTYSEDRKNDTIDRLKAQLREAGAAAK